MGTTGATEQAGGALDAPTVLDWMETYGRVARYGMERLGRAVMEDPSAASDPLDMSGAMSELVASLWRDPTSLAAVQMSLWANYTALAGYTASRMLGLDPEPVARPAADDWRFRDEAWTGSPAFDALKQAYLLTARAMVEAATGPGDLDPRVAQRLQFVVGQVMDAMAPTNFAATNPEVLRETVETGGRNLLTGVGRMLEDLERSDGKLRVRMIEDGAFELGETIATTPGKVVFENEMMQLLQYEPRTEKVHRRPLLIVPPWMNKYYVLDLRPETSMVGWLVEQGYTVFIVSWVNPDESYAHKGFEDYLLEGPVAALEAIERATGERQVNVTGYCLGGILLAATVAWLEAKGEDRIRSATYLTTMVDFGDVGPISVFIDEDTLEPLEREIREQGYLSGKSVADAWSAVRSNDLVWSFYINSYLLGRSPRPWDILYWNADSTNMPAAMHTFFMRNMYLENRLREPGGIELAGVPIDVTRVTTPAYVMSTIEDHIAPWETTYRTTGLFAGPTRFVLGGSGHIAGVVNPPARGKYGYWTNTANPASAKDWFEGSTEHEGSWWPDWDRWLRRHGGGKVAARVPGDGELDVLEDAPGSYARKRI